MLSTTNIEENWQQQFLARHQLSESYLLSAHKWFDPLVNAIAVRQNGARKPLVIGVNGCQGSGKSTLCDYISEALTHSHQLSAIAVSLDDFYLTRAERIELSQTIHPLFLTRGVPGTHDHSLLLNTLRALQGKGSDSVQSTDVRVPRFDKARDDRASPVDWERVAAPVDVILLEGWCLGATAQPAEALRTPVNALEAEEDPEGIWRGYSNSTLNIHFPSLYAEIDSWVMLAAPSFEAVLGWRSEQEQKLFHRRESASDPQNDTAYRMDRQALEHFVNHFERITRHCLNELPAKVHYLYQLDGQRNIIEYRTQPHAGIKP